MKNYYQILNVIDTAPPEVIKHAYRALASLYHPDKCSDETAVVKMAEINEAYSVLIDPVRRYEYDTKRKNQYYTTENNLNNTSKHWFIAKELYPNLQKIEDDLRLISDELFLTFEKNIISTKQFDQATIIAVRLKNEFLKSYFCSNRKIQKIGLYYITSNNFSAATELSDFCHSQGESAEFDRIYDYFISKYPVPNTVYSEQELSTVGDYSNLDATRKNNLPNNHSLYVILIASLILFMFLSAS